ncbi:hypothetical protein LSAT2_021676, partial [Lamellibrachia satsuma]
MAVAWASLVASSSWRDFSRLLLPALLDMSSAPGMDRPERGTACYVLKCVVISELSKFVRRELRSVVCCYFVTQSPSNEHVLELQDHSSTSSRCQMGKFQVS